VPCEVMCENITLPEKSQMTVRFLDT